MIAALAYMQWCSWVNRARFQVSRLKRPKYLAGALVGMLMGGWFFFSIFWRNPFGATHLGTHVRVLVELLGAVFLLLQVMLVWLITAKRVAFNFTEAEVAFLFAAPVKRRSLVHYKLMKAQAGILASSLLMTVILGGLGGWGRFLTCWVGCWLVFSAVNLHYLGASLTRTLMLDRGRTHWQRRHGILGVVLVSGGLLVWLSRGSLPGPPDGLTTSLAVAGDYAKAILQSHPFGWVLIPFRLVLGPLLAPDWPGFLLALVPALGVLGLCYWWVITSQASFEEATIEKARELGRVVAAMRSGDWQLARPPRRARWTPFALRPIGSPIIALVWKNLIAAESAFRLGFAAIVGLGYWIAAFALHTFEPASSWTAMVTTLPLAFGGWLFFIGPQLARFDLRQDLRIADVLKIYPVPGWQLVLGEVLAPTLLLTLLEYAVIAFAITVFPHTHQGPPPPLAIRLTYSLAAVIILPMLNLVQILFYNGVALFLPAWMRADSGGAQGFEAAGLQMLVLVGQVLVLALSLLIPVGAFVLVHVLGRPWMGSLAAVPLGTLVATIVLGGEALVGLHMLGDLFERLDVSDELLA